MVADTSVQFDVTTVRQHGGMIIRVAGDLDIGTAPRLIATVVDLIDEGCGRIDLDCSGVAFIDSAGIRALVVSRNEATQRGTILELVAASPSMSRVLEMTGLSSLLAAPAGS